MAKTVEGLAPSSRGKPRAWESGQAVLGPGFKRDGERVLQRILGELKVAEISRIRRSTTLENDTSARNRISAGKTPLP